MWKVLCWSGRLQTGAGQKRRRSTGSLPCVTESRERGQQSPSLWRLFFLFLGGRCWSETPDEFGSPLLANSLKWELNSRPLSFTVVFKETMAIHVFQAVECCISGLLRTVRGHYTARYDVLRPRGEIGRSSTARWGGTFFNRPVRYDVLLPRGEIGRCSTQLSIYYPLKYLII